MSPEQCRAARGWLSWSQRDLAKRAGVSASTIREFEAGRRVPIANNLKAIRTVFEDAGIRLTFTDHEPLGVSFPPQPPPPETAKPRAKRSAKRRR